MSQTYKSEHKLFRYKIFLQNFFYAYRYRFRSSPSYSNDVTHPGCIARYKRTIGTTTTFGIMYFIFLIKLVWEIHFYHIQT